MPIARLADNRYGKSRVRLMRVTRHSGHHDLDEWTIEILLRGAFETAHTLGDNAQILPTDTMKNTCYVVAAQAKPDSIEAYAFALLDHILSRNAQVASAEVTVHSHLWKRLMLDGVPAPDAFMRGSAEVQTTHIEKSQNGSITVRSGLDGLNVLKTSKSSFFGYIQDEYTTLAETRDRLFGTVVRAEWTYAIDAIRAGIDFNKVRTHLRETMLRTFATHDSLSVQQTLYQMAEDALAHTAIIDRVDLRMPNKHNLLVDLARFGIANENHIFVPTDEPHGTIEATVVRA